MNRAWQNRIKQTTFPTFSNVIAKANASAALQAAENELKVLLAEQQYAEFKKPVYITYDDYSFKYDGNKLTDVTGTAFTIAAYHPVYAKTTDKEIDTKVTYFTVSDSKYTAVTSPEKANIANYYVVSGYEGYYSRTNGKVIDYVDCADYANFSAGTIKSAFGELAADVVKTVPAK